MAAPDLKGIGRTEPLTEEQQKVLHTFQDLTHEYASRIRELLPRGPALSRFLECIREAQTHGEAAIKIGRTILTPDIVADLFADVEARDVSVIRIWMNAYEYADVRKFGRDVLDVESQATLWKQGIQGSIWNAQIRTSRKIPKGHLYLTASDEGNADLAEDWQPDPAKLIKL